MTGIYDSLIGKCLLITVWRTFGQTVGGERLSEEDVEHVQLHRVLCYHSDLLLSITVNNCKYCSNLNTELIINLQ